MPLALVLLLAACARDGELDETGGISAVRSPCPAVAVPAATGDVTLFNPPGSTDARAVELTAVITNVRSTCGPSGTDIVAQANFDVIATRTNTSGARDVVLPYFVTVVQGGDTVVAKRINRVTVHFDDGQRRGTGRGQGGSVIAASAAQLPPAIVERLQKKRKASDPDASIDPMAAPEVRSAVARATFELLVGFQLTPEQLRYNATR